MSKWHRLLWSAISGTGSCLANSRVNSFPKPGDAHGCFYEKAHSVKGQRGGLREATRSQPKPLRAPVLFALRLSQSKVARCSMGSVRGKALPFEPRPPMESGGHTPNIRSRLRTVSVGRARLISLLPLSERACPSALSRCSWRRDHPQAAAWPLGRLAL